MLSVMPKGRRNHEVLSYKGKEQHSTARLVYLLIGLFVLCTKPIPYDNITKTVSALTYQLLMHYSISVFTVVQNRISAFWFEGKELAFAFGCTLAFSRLVRE